MAERRGRLPCWACSGAAAAAVQQPLQQPRQCKLCAGRWRWSTHCTDREQFLSPTRIAQCLTSYRHIIGITRLQSRPRGLFSARPHTHRHQPCPSRPPSLLPRVGSKSTWVRTRSFACSTVSQTVVDGFRGDETAETVALRWRVLSVVIHQKIRPHHFAGRTRLQARIHVRRCSSASQSASDSVCHGAM